MARSLDEVARLPGLPAGQIWSQRADELRAVVGVSIQDLS